MSPEHTGSSQALSGVTSVSPWKALVLVLVIVVVTFIMVVCNDSPLVDTCGQCAHTMLVRHSLRSQSNRLLVQ